MLLTDDTEVPYPRLYSHVGGVLATWPQSRLTPELCSDLGWLVLWKGGPVFSCWEPYTRLSAYTEQELLETPRYTQAYPFVDTLPLSIQQRLQQGPRKTATHVTD